MLNLAIFKNQDVNGKVVLDVDTYRQRRAEALAREAKIAMSRVLKSRTSIKMKPLISAERRMIHNQVHQDKGSEPLPSVMGEKDKLSFLFQKVDTVIDQIGIRKTLKADLYKQKNKIQTNKNKFAKSLPCGRFFYCNK